MSSTRAKKRKQKSTAVPRKSKRLENVKRADDSEPASNAAREITLPTTTESIGRETSVSDDCTISRLFVAIDRREGATDAAWQLAEATFRERVQAWADADPADGGPARKAMRNALLAARDSVRWNDAWRAVVHHHGRKCRLTRVVVFIGDARVQLDMVDVLDDNKDFGFVSTVEFNSLRAENRTSFTQLLLVRHEATTDDCHNNNNSTADLAFLRRSALARESQTVDVLGDLRECIDQPWASNLSQDMLICLVLCALSPDVLFGIDPPEYHFYDAVCDVINQEK
eukprot:TRINITY_DN5027_c0_g1_i1.p1 TRINITY_DN5027_c0_g1~~TRINITY_DN5027_c0_g1_i1.p1  ORF type:complete len:299 (-),score=47.61 TRINITY_DN5027_c0_g1_i1:64-915(-)